MDACMPFLRTLFPFLFKGGGGQGDAAGGGGLISKLEHEVADVAKKEIGQIEKVAENKIHQVEATVNTDLAKLQQQAGASNSMLGKLESRALGFAAKEVNQGEAALDQNITKYGQKAAPQGPPK